MDLRTTNVPSPAPTAIASLSASLTDKLLSQLIGSIVSKMDDKSVGLDLRRTYIQTLSAISRSGSYRLCKQLDAVVPIVLAQCEGGKFGGDPELIESCLQAFESFVMRCPKEVQPYEEQITRSAQHYLSYDPNYEDEDNYLGEDDEDDDIDKEEDDAEYSDDDDISWKVRRAAAKVLSAIIIYRPERLAQFVFELAPVLITCFKEREENVKMDVFTTFNDMLIQVGAARELEAVRESASKMRRGAVRPSRSASSFASWSARQSSSADPGSGRTSTPVSCASVAAQAWECATAGRARTSIAACGRLRTRKRRVPAHACGHGSVLSTIFSSLPSRAR